MIHFQLPAEYAKKLAEALTMELANIKDPENGFIDVEIHAYDHGNDKAHPDTTRWYWKLMPDGHYSSYDD